MSSKRTTRSSRTAPPKVSKDIIVLPEPTPVEASEGEKALTEAAAIAGGFDLSSQQQLNQIRRLVRGDKVETHLHRIFIVGAWVAAVGVFASFGVLFWHKLAPDHLRFLSEDNIKDVYEFLFTGALGGVVTKGGERLIGKPPEKI